MAAFNLAAGVIAAGTAALMCYRRRFWWAMTMAGLAGLNAWLFWR
jgi:hypothetical protein